MKPLLTDLWPQFAEDAEFRSAFGGAVVDKVLANRQPYYGGVQCTGTGAARGVRQAGALSGAVI